jgi:hypothetical protein
MKPSSLVVNFFEELPDFTFRTGSFALKIEAAVSREMFLNV